MIFSQIFLKKIVFHSKFAPSQNSNYEEYSYDKKKDKRIKGI